MDYETFKKEAYRKADELGNSLSPLLTRSQVEKIMSIYYMDLLDAFYCGVEHMEQVATDVIQGT